MPAGAIMREDDAKGWVQPVSVAWVVTLPRISGQGEGTVELNIRRFKTAEIADCQ